MNADQLAVLAILVGLICFGATAWRLFAEMTAPADDEVA